MGVHGCVRVCVGVCGCVYAGAGGCAWVWVGGCGCAWVCACVRDEFSEFLLENRVPTSADFNTFPIRIFYHSRAIIKFQILLSLTVSGFLCTFTTRLSEKSNCTQGPTFKKCLVILFKLLF